MLQAAAPLEAASRVGRQQPGGVGAPCALAPAPRPSAGVSQCRRHAMGTAGAGRAPAAAQLAHWRCAALAGSTSSSASSGYIHTASMDEEEWQETYGVEPLRCVRLRGVWANFRALTNRWPHVCCPPCLPSPARCRYGISLEQGVRGTMEDAAQVVPHGRCGFFIASELRGVVQATG